MNTRLPAQVLLDLIEQRRFGVEYQPIIALNDSTILGYEALARFYDRSGAALSPQLVFDSLHGSPLSLFQVEHAMKRLQLAHAPDDGGRLFVNLDPDAFQAGGQDGSHALVMLLAQNSRVVVEIIENSNVNDADISGAMAEAFAANHIELALDDIGAPRSLVSLPILLAVNYMKFDRSWVLHPDDPARCALLRHLVAFARECGKHTILEGVENQAQLDFATTIGFDYVQGFLFRPLFRNSGCLATDG
jgi:EAL domain-containing protein (putative c-di-GMP-specific phosphodiesterase class I)